METTGTTTQMGPTTRSSMDLKHYDPTEEIKRLLLTIDRMGTHDWAWQWSSPQFTTTLDDGASVRSHMAPDLHLEQVVGWVHASYGLPNIAIKTSANFSCTMESQESFRLTGHHTLYISTGSVASMHTNENSRFFDVHSNSTQLRTYVLLNFFEYHSSPFIDYPTLCISVHVNISNIFDNSSKCNWNKLLVESHISLNMLSGKLIYVQLSIDFDIKITLFFKVSVHLQLYQSWTSM